MATINDYGDRQDGSPKGKGFLGELKRPDGGISTEVSIGVEIDGKEMEIPSLVPGLSQEEIDAVLKDEMPDSVVDKAVEHARQRMSAGKSVFFEEETVEKATGKPWEQSWGAQDDIMEEATPTPMSASKKPWERSWGIVDAVVNTAKEVVVDAKFELVFKGLVGAESRGVHRTDSGELLSSPVGARGVTQLMPGTQKDPGYGVKPAQDESREEFIRVGRDYLKAMLNKYDGDYEKALAAYNAGPRNVDNAVRKGGVEWIQFLPKKRETIPYINKILGTSHPLRRNSRNGA